MDTVPGAGGPDQCGLERGGRRMNGTPRILNRDPDRRSSASSSSPSESCSSCWRLCRRSAVWWQDWAAGVWNIWRDLFERTRFPGRAESWLWIVVVLLLLLVIGAMVAWVAQQGKGRANLLVSEEDPGDVPGQRQDRQRRGRAGTPGRLGGPSGPGRRHRRHLRIPRRTGPEDQDPAPPGRGPAPARGRGVRPRGGARRRARQAHPGAHPYRLRVPGRGSGGPNGSADRRELPATSLSRHARAAAVAGFR